MRGVTCHGLSIWFRSMISITFREARGNLDPPLFSLTKRNHVWLISLRFVMPERYFVFTCCSANASVSARTRKRKNFDPRARAYACVKAVFMVK